MGCESLTEWRASCRPRRRARREQDRGQIADEVFAADRLVVVDRQLRAIRRRHLLHQVVSRLGRHLLGAHAEGEEELALLEADAVADETEHAGGAQRVVAALRAELALPRQRAGLAE